LEFFSSALRAQKPPLEPPYPKTTHIARINLASLLSHTLIPHGTDKYLPILAIIFKRKREIKKITPKPKHIR
jgi:hypothetical protein